MLGSGHHGSLRECIDRFTGESFTINSVCKRDPAVKLRGLASEILLLKEMKHNSIIQLVDMFEDFEYVHIVANLCEDNELFDQIVEKVIIIIIVQQL